LKYGKKENSRHEKHKIYMKPPFVGHTLAATNLYRSNAMNIGS